MKWKLWWKKNEDDEELQDLENKLNAILLPVTPRPEYVNELRIRLMKPAPEISLHQEPQNQRIQTGLLITGGVLGAIAMVLTGVRGLVSIAGVIGLLINMIKHNSQSSPPVPSNYAH